MEALTVIIVIAVLGLFGVLVIRARRGKARDKGVPPTEIANKSTVPEPPSEPPPPVTEVAQAAPSKGEPSEDLSQSGAITIEAEIDRCVAAERWDEAIKWSLHAIQALPDRDEFKVRLAEIYAKAENREKFVPLFEALQPKLAENDEQKERLLAIATSFVPDHPLVQGRTEGK